MPLALGGQSDAQFLAVLVGGLAVVVLAHLLLAWAGREPGGPRRHEETPDAARGLSRLDLLVAALYALVLGGLAAGTLLVALAETRRDLGQVLWLPWFEPGRVRAGVALILVSVGGSFLACCALAARRPPRRRLGFRDRKLVAICGFVVLLVWIPVLVALFG